MLVVVQLFQSSLRYSTRTEKRLVATLLAQSRVEEIRLWARTAVAGGYNFDNWAGLPVGPFATHPDYVVTVSPPVAQAVGSPSTSLAPGRTMNNSLMKLAVDVSYNPYGASDHVRLVVTIGDPRRQLASVTVSPVGGFSSPLAPPPASGVLEAVAQDVDGRAVRDVFFAWTQEPGLPLPGVAHLSDGPYLPTRRVTVVNEVMLANGSYAAPPPPRGSCLVRARARGFNAGTTSEVVGTQAVDL